LCCFVRPGEVALTWTDNKRDPQYAVSLDAYERLQSARDARGRKLKIHKLPMPGPLYRTAEEESGVDAVDQGQPARVAGERLAASYVNLYIANSTVVMPLPDRKKDRRAANISQPRFPDRRVNGDHSRELLLRGGNIHSITQQVPSAAATSTRTRRARKA